MSTKVVNEQGDLLWGPNDFGDYSIEKIQLISSILRELLSSVTLSTKTVTEGGDTSGFYTKNESDNRYLLAETATSLIEVIAKQSTDTYLKEGGAVSLTDFTQVRGWLIRLNRLVEGVDLDNPQEAAGNYITLRIESLETKEQANASNILGLQRDVYKSNGDGSISSEVKFTYAEDMGITKKDKMIVSLSEGFGTYRSTIVTAMNYLMTLIENLDQSQGDSVTDLSNKVKTLEDFKTAANKDITSLKSSVGDVELQTEAKNLRGAVNELKDQIGTLSDSITATGNSITEVAGDVGDLGDLDASLSGSISLVDALNSIVSSLSSIENRLNVLEGNSGSVE